MNFFRDLQYSQSQTSQKRYSGHPAQEINSTLDKSSKTRKSQAKPKVQKFANYHWSTSEQKRYINFLVEKRALFDLSLKLKRSVGVHTIMSKYIKQKTSTQCRSHHQKMLTKFENIENIISSNLQLLKPSNLKKLHLPAPDKTQSNEIQPEHDQLVLPNLLDGTFYFDGYISQQIGLVNSQNQSYQFD